MTKRSHYNLSVVNKLLKLTFGFLCDVSGIRVISIFYNIASRLNSHIAEAIFKVAYLCWTKRIVRCREHYCFGPIVNGGMRFLNTKQKTFAIFTCSGLPYIHDGIIRFVSAKQEINSALFENI